MKRAFILPAVAIILLAIFVGPYLLLLLIVIPIAYFFIDRLEKAAPKRVFYKAQDKVIVCGEEMRLSDLEGVMSKNLATPYTIDEYAVVIATKDPLHPTIQLRVGYDGGLAGEIAAEIDKHILRPA